ncbi:MAG: NADH-ubiquinone oxidoreductase-F iron-sulfur binding region domain-containing protein [Planctomycetota bacterium]|jgi:NADH:ubiquinone oxidoreductase subunit F (NADH-binding)/(2Fe-2S) ferredoxin/Pyruvate/2-oxoacid:ferredoxin oxidoreductase delta subunit
MDRIESPEALADLRERIRAARDPDRLRIVVCGGTGCRSAGSMKLAEAFKERIESRKLDCDVSLKLCGCHGFCQQGPVVVVEPLGVFYREVGLGDVERDVDDIIEMTVSGGEPVERLLYTNPATGECIAQYDEIPFYSMQTRIVLSNNGKIDPESIEDYIAEGGYSALAKVLSMDPEEVTSWVSRSGLRGRGGGGFPTGKKWEFCRQAPDRSMRYIICNADEGDPGAFMDRSIVEGDPHAVVEGMVIGAYAIARGVGPARGYVYIRAEYPLAIDMLRSALQNAEEMGLLGDGILGTDFNFRIEVKEGAGAFVCGEETALIASIEGRRGMPRQRPPFPATSGLFGKPTNINNVETWATVPKIITGGPEWFADIGTEGSKGTKVFSLVGKVKNSGLVEVPMGMKLRDIIFDIGGGVPEGERFKAVQTGGPSGGCLPESCLDLPVDFDALAEAGSIMGSGGMVVMDEATCIPDVARYFVAFTREESCGKCTPCRLGTWQMQALLDDICSGAADADTLAVLQELAESIKISALCGLGQTAPNPVLTTMRYFEDEYLAHVNEGRCPAGVCKSLVRFSVDEEKCKACGACKRACAAGAITGERKQVHVINQGLCVRCGACNDVCKFDAVIVA